MDQALDTRLARAAHTQDTPLAGLLADLEGADWALLFPGQAALFAALAAIFGGAILRADPRVPVAEAAWRAAGLEPGSLAPDWEDSAVWLLEPDERAVSRAGRAGARLIADATFRPGSRLLDLGADLIAYRHAGVLSGHADVPFAALLGRGEVPEVSAGLPLLSEALLRRDLASFRARFREQVSAAGLLAERLGERAEIASGAVLLFYGDLPSTALFAPERELGGVLSARHPVPEGTLLSVGLEDAEDLWRDLSGDVAPLPGAVDEATPEVLEPAGDLDAPQEDLPQDADPPQDADLGEQPQPQQPLPEVPLAPDLPSAPSAAESSADLTEDLTEAQRAAFERLREWRNAEARRQEVSRFIIASNATLAEIARRAPQSESELRAVRGMGPERVRKYAGPLLNMVRGLDQA